MGRYTQILFAGLLLSLCTLSMACSILFYTHQYQRSGEHVAYHEVGERGNVKQSTLPQVRWDTFKPVIPVPVEKAVSPFLQDDEYRYFTDGQFIVWNGKILTNAPSEPAVDVASFRAASRMPSFATDQFSIYADGQRIGDNTGDKRVDLDKLAGNDSGIMLDDGTHLFGLYFTGLDRYQRVVPFGYLGSAKNFRLIKKYYVRDNGSCSSHGTDYVISATEDTVFLNHSPLLGADAASFKIIRWMPEFGYLYYEDKHGQHFYSYLSSSQFNHSLWEREFGFRFESDNTIDQPSLEAQIQQTILKAVFSDSNSYGYKNLDNTLTVKLPFVLGVDTVFYINQQKALISLPFINPENAIVFQPNVVFDGDKVFYQFDQNNQIQIIRAKSMIKQQVDYAKTGWYGLVAYIIDDGNAWHFLNNGKGFYAKQPKAGTLSLVGEFWAVDERYVYMLFTGERFATAKPKKVRVQGDQLITVEGQYDQSGKFTSAANEPNAQ